MTEAEQRRKHIREMLLNSTNWERIGKVMREANKKELRDILEEKQDEAERPEEEGHGS